MAKNKLQRYEDIKYLDNVIEMDEHNFTEPGEVRGRWSLYFGNDNPIVLELACGKGEYTRELAKRNPGRNYIGIDRKGDRIWKGAVDSLENELDNVRFLRIHIDHITSYFAPSEVDEIWITFPDPQMKKERKRLTSPMFIDRYRQIMKPGGIIHLKTDSHVLYEYTSEIIRELNLEIIRVIPDIYRLDRLPDDLDIRTYYEESHLKSGKTIRYISFAV
ncbi:MAG: tRNA (guanosine(46)-N7)-methyltransferase TrmB [Balneolaceae bacterium]|nr:MAG: tRNA (guanosine(46)-N7)-methyltransferase TrmB [Balneolaceae bacterium]